MSVNKTKLGERVTEFVRDMVTLDVLTLTGNLTFSTKPENPKDVDGAKVAAAEAAKADATAAKIAADATPDKPADAKAAAVKIADEKAANAVAAAADVGKLVVDWDTIFQDAVSRMGIDNSKLDVVAYTHAEWDLDSVNFVRKDLGEADQKLVDAHNASVASAQKSRFEAVKIVAGLVGLDS